MLLPLLIMSGCAYTHKINDPTPEYLNVQSVLRLCRFKVVHAGRWRIPATEELVRRGEDPALCYARVEWDDTSRVYGW